MDYKDFTDVEFLASLADGTYFDNVGDYDPEISQDLELDPLSTDAPTSAAPESSPVEAPAAAEGSEPAVEPEAPAMTTPPSTPAPAPKPAGFDALAEGKGSNDSRADSVLGG